MVREVRIRRSTESTDLQSLLLGREHIICLCHEECLNSYQIALKTFLLFFGLQSSPGNNSVQNRGEDFFFDFNGLENILQKRSRDAKTLYKILRATSAKRL